MKERWKKGEQKDKYDCLYIFMDGTIHTQYAWDGELEVDVVCLGCKEKHFMHYGKFYEYLNECDTLIDFFNLIVVLANKDDPKQIAAKIIAIKKEKGDSDERS